jgi:hypothetical protein
MTMKAQHTRPTEPSAGSNPDLRAAYQAHTLAQMIHGQSVLGNVCPLHPQYLSGPPYFYEPSPQPVAMPWTVNERCGFAWTGAGWPL